MPDISESSCKFNLTMFKTLTTTLFSSSAKGGKGAKGKKGKSKDDMSVKSEKVTRSKSG